MSCQAAHPFGRLNVSIYALYRTVAFWGSLLYLIWCLLLTVCAFYVF